MGKFLYFQHNFILKCIMSALLFIFMSITAVYGTESNIVDDIKKAIYEKDIDIVLLSAEKMPGTINFTGDIDTLFSNIERSVTDQRVTFVIFSETFFSTNPLKTDLVNQILAKCHYLTNRKQRCFVFINFLHAFKSNERPEWLPAIGISSAYSEQLVTTSARNPSVLFNSYSSAEYRLVNYSLCVWNGRNIAYYRKSTYCKENDDLCVSQDEHSCNHGSHMYEFGDWAMHSLCDVDDDYNKIYSILFANNFVCLRICADINQGTEHFDTLKDKEGICVIQANGVPGVGTNIAVQGIHKHPTPFFDNAAVGCIFIIVDSHVKNTPGSFRVDRVSEGIQFNEIPQNTGELCVSRTKLTKDKKCCTLL